LGNFLIILCKHSSIPPVEGGKIVVMNRFLGIKSWNLNFLGDKKIDPKKQRFCLIIQ